MLYTGLVKSIEQPFYFRIYKIYSKMFFFLVLLLITFLFLRPTHFYGKVYIYKNKQVVPSFSISLYKQTIQEEKRLPSSISSLRML